jgi:hypothetical protein
MPIEKHAEWMVVLLCLPDKEPEPAGILLLDVDSDQLAVKLKTNAPIEHEIVSAFWNDLERWLTQESLEKGGQKVAAWLETSASHAVRLSMRNPIQLRSGSLPETLESLYRKHVERPAISR